MSGGAVIIVMTRWSEDDLVGRIIDPNNPHYNAKVAARWSVLHLPGTFEEEHQAVAKKLNKKVGDVLWPEWYDQDFHDEFREQSAADYAALYQGSPSPADGDIIKAQWLRTYEPEELPDNLVYYGASDHGVTTKTKSDPSVIGCVGVDPNGIGYIMPDIIWERMDTQRTVNAIITQIKTYKPPLWWLEDELISKSFGPFLKEQLVNQNCFWTALDPQRPSSDKVTRVRSSTGLLAMGRIRFPARALWWEKAKHQLLTFPNGANDDFVDWLSWIGLGLLKIVTQEVRPQEEPRPEHIVGTPQWVRHQSRQEAARRAASRASRLGY
jgi:predicted phage terminase large subunit-like protein